MPHHHLHEGPRTEDSWPRATTSWSSNVTAGAPDGYRRLVIHPTAEPLNKPLAVELMLMLGSARLSFALDFVVTAERVEHALVCQAMHAATFQRLIYGVAPSWDIVLTNEAHRDDLVVVATPGLTSVLHRGDRSDLLALADLDTFRAFDPLIALREAVRPLTEYERLVVRYLVRPTRPERAQRAQSELFFPLPLCSLGDVVSAAFGRRSYVPRFERRLHDQFVQRLRQATCEILGVVSMHGPNHSRLQDRAVTLRTILTSRFDPEQHGLILSNWEAVASSVPPPPSYQAKDSWLLVTPAELSAFWHLHSEDDHSSAGGSRQRPRVHVPSGLVRPTGITLGLHHQRGEDLPVRLPLRDLQLGHAILLGKTRVGKTTLAHQMAAQITQTLPDASLIIIDPNGDWAVDFAARSVQPERASKTYLLEFGDPDFPPSLPVLTPPPGVSLDSFTKVTFETIKLIFRDHWSSTRMETIMFKTVASLVQVPGSTLLDVERLYTDVHFRQQVARHVHDADLRAYWRSFDQLSRGQQLQMTEPILNRLSVFTRSAAIRNITCRPERGFDIGNLIDEGADLLISTAGAAIHDEADLLVEFLISRIHLAVFARLGRQGSRAPVFLAIDESQHVKGPSLPVLLSEAAKTGLCVIALSQYLDQWSPALAQSILGNVGTTIVFSVGPNDSATLARTLRPYTAHDAEDLDRFEALVKTRVDGASVPTFDIRTMPLEAPVDPIMLERIREQTRSRFTVPAQASRPAAEHPAEVVDLFEE